MYIYLKEIFLRNCAMFNILKFQSSEILQNFTTFLDFPKTFKIYRKIFKISKKISPFFQLKFQQLPKPHVRFCLLIGRLKCPNQPNEPIRSQNRIIKYFFYIIFSQI